MVVRKSEGYGGIGVLVKGELYDEAVEVKRVNDRVMSLAIVFVEVVRVVKNIGMCSSKWKIYERKMFLSKNM